MFVHYPHVSDKMPAAPTPLMECAATNALESFSQAMSKLTGEMNDFLRTHGSSQRCACPLCVECPHLSRLLSSLMILIEVQTDLLDNQRPMPLPVYWDVRGDTPPCATVDAKAGVLSSHPEPR